MPKNKSKSKVTNAGATMIDEDGFEILGGDSAGLEVGEQCEGTFAGVVRTLESKRKGQPPVPVYGIGSRTLIGSAVLKDRIESGGVMPGDYLKITRLDDGEAKKGQNPPKLYDVRVRRITSKARGK